MSEPSTALFTQASRPLFLISGNLVVARKSARILAKRMDYPFVVETDRGPMRAEAGDWLVTNHPEDDAGSDLWSISDERFRSTYEVVG